MRFNIVDEETTRKSSRVLVCILLFVVRCHCSHNPLYFQQRHINLRILEDQTFQDRVLRETCKVLYSCYTNFLSCLSGAECVL